MAEGISVYCRGPKWDELSAWLDLHAKRMGAGPWCYPAVDYLLLVYDAGHDLADYEQREKDELIQALDGPPTAGVIMELRRTRQREACDAATQLTLSLMQRFEAVADDECGQYWSRHDILESLSSNAPTFLDCYRESHT